MCDLASLQVEWGNVYGFTIANCDTFCECICIVVALNYSDGFQVNETALQAEDKNKSTVSLLHLGILNVCTQKRVNENILLEEEIRSIRFFFHSPFCSFHSVIFVMRKSKDEKKKESNTKEFRSLQNLSSCVCV